MQLSRRNAAWGLWLAIVLGFFNSCAGRVECRDTGKWLAAGGWTLTPAIAVRALRALGTDDADIQRYHAYANAALGLPYQATFVRPLEGWKVDTHVADESFDAADPEIVPPVTPPKPLAPYRDFLVEYPPGFFLFTVPPALVAHSMEGYATVFSLFMGLLLTAALALLCDVARRLAPAREGTGGLRTSTFVFFAAICALAVGPVLVRRYDAVVSLSICLVVWGCVTKRPWATGLGFGLGVAAKGMPLLLAPIALVYFLTADRRREIGRVVLVATAVGVASVIPFAGAAGAHMFDLFAYHGQRPLQVESTGGALLILGRLFFPGAASMVQTYGSMNIASSWEAPLERLASILPLGAVIVVVVLSTRYFRSAPTDEARARVLLRGACATLAFFMVLGKVFSPQYVTWLVPLGVLASLLDSAVASRWMLLVALALTQLIWPTCYSLRLAANLSPIFGALVLARNGLLFAWAWRITKPPATEPAYEASGSPSPSASSVAPAKSTVASSR